MTDRIEDILGSLDEEARIQQAAVLRREIARRRRAAEAARLPRIHRTEKRCPRCQLLLPIEAFGANAARPDGHQSICRSCRQNS